jgi:hypothetical protein
VHREGVGDVADEVDVVLRRRGSSTSVVRCTTRSSRRAIMRGVKPALINLRMRVWVGGSLVRMVWPWFSGAVGVGASPSSEL